MSIYPRLRWSETSPLENPLLLSRFRVLPSHVPREPALAVQQSADSRTRPDPGNVPCHYA